MREIDIFSEHIQAEKNHDGECCMMYDFRRRQNWCMEARRRIFVSTARYTIPKLADTTSQLEAGISARHQICGKLYYNDSSVWVLSF